MDTHTDTHRALQMAFAGNPLRRHSERRPSPAWLEASLALPTTRLIVFHKGNPLQREGRIVMTRPAMLPEGSDLTQVFLGCDLQDHAYFAVDLSALDKTEAAGLAGSGGSFASLRDSAMGLPRDDLAIAGHARWLLDWHRRHRFCARCGAESAMVEAGARRHCNSCETDHFPRTDPVAIVLIHDGDSCLLGRSPRFPPGFYSCLAGFVEPSETLEECAVREVREEVGVEICDPVYRLSQPWPFPSSLMVGFTATACTRDIRIDDEEIADARWFTRADILGALTGPAPDAPLLLPPDIAIARHLIADWAHGR